MKAGVLAVVLASTLTAQQVPPPPAGALAPGGTGLVAGQVVDPGTGQPVGEVVVSLRVGTVFGSESPRVLTDPEGRFVFVNVPAGRYGLRAMKLGYLTGDYGQRTPGSTWDASQDFYLTAGQILTDITVPAWKSAAISGRITDEAGEPVVGVRVDVLRKAVWLGEVGLIAQESNTLRNGLTDDTGAYRITNLPPGEYTVAVPTTLTTFPVEIMSETQRGGDLSAPAFFTLQDTNGPLGDARNQQVGNAVLLVGNRSVIPPAPAGPEVRAVYRTTFAPGTPRTAAATIVSLRSGEERSLDVSLQPTRAVRVTGRLTGPNGAMAHTALRLFDAGPWRVGYFSRNEGATVTALTDESGRFTFLGVPDGEYSVRMQEGNPQRGYVVADERVTVGSSDISDLVVTSRSAPRVSGRFEFRGVKPPEPNPQGWGSVFIMDETQYDGLGTLLLVPSVPDFRFEGSTLPGKYVLRVFSPVDLTCTSVMWKERDVSDELLVVGTEDIELVAICGEPPTRLRGTIRKTDGAVDPDAAAVIFPVDRQFWIGPAVRPRRLQRAVADRKGEFSFVNLPAGEYLVAAIPLERSALWQDPKFLETVARSATRVTLGPGESRTADLRTVQIK